MRASVAKAVRVQAPCQGDGESAVRSGLVRSCEGTPLRGEDARRRAANAPAVRRRARGGCAGRRYDGDRPRSGRFFLLVNVQAVVQRVQADAENLGGRTLVAVEVRERAHDELALDVPDGPADLQALELALLSERALEAVRQLELS